MAGCMPFRTRISAFKARVGPVQLPVPIQSAASDNEAVVILRLSSPSAEVAARRNLPPGVRCRPQSRRAGSTLLALEFDHGLVSRSISTISDWDYCSLLIGPVMRHS
jgi:hypothetical protein